MKDTKKSDGGQAVRRTLLPASTPVPNFFFDEILILPGLSDAKLRVLLVLWRATVGWCKSADWISVSQLQRKAGGIGRYQAVRAARFWEEAGLFQRSKDGARGMVRYRLVDGLDREAVVARIRQLVSGRNRYRPETRSGSGLGTSLVPGRNTHKAIQSKQLNQSKGGFASQNAPAYRKRKKKDARIKGTYTVPETVYAQ